jgi:hypothetical protein
MLESKKSITTSLEEKQRLQMGDMVKLSSLIMEQSKYNQAF